MDHSADHTDDLDLDQLLRTAGPAISVPVLAKIFGVSRSHLYSKINSGQLDLPVIRVGKRRIIPTSAVRRALHVDDDVARPAS